MSSCNTAFAKHIIPVFTSPRARRGGSAALPVEREGVTLLRRARDSALGNGGTRDGGGKAWMEKPTTDEAGSRGLEVEAAPESQDSNDSIRAVMSGSVHGATISRFVVPSGV